MEAVVFGIILSKQQLSVEVPLLVLVLGCFDGSTGFGVVPSGIGVKEFAIRSGVLQIRRESRRT